MKQKFKKIFIIILLIIILLPCISLITCDVVYSSILNTRFTTQEPLNFTIDKFDGLKRKQYAYNSNDDYKLCGYLYFNENTDINNNGLIIVVHGLGSGHRVYMEVINYFVNNNYYVFSYDSSGTDESEGKIKGLPQQLIDLHYTIKYIDTIDIISDLPIYLFGHSWGGYAVSNILNYCDNIEAVVSVAGFNSSSDIILSYGKTFVSFIAYIGLPIVKFYENMKFGDYSKSNAIDAFNKSNANVMIIHSEDDNVVPIEVGYNLYYDKFKYDNRFTFLKYKNRGHSFVIYSDEAIKEINSFNNKFDNWLKTLNYNYNKEKNKERFVKDKLQYYNENLDYNLMCNLIDKELFSQIIDFYNIS